MKKKIFSNRNIIIALTALFMLWLLFLDRNNLMTLRTVDRQIEELEAERDFYRSKIDADSAVIRGLSDSAFVEKYARENFFMKESDQTIYIFK